MDNLFNLLVFSAIVAIAQGQNPRDCHEVKENGNSANGLYIIYPEGPGTTGFAIFCILDGDGEPQNIIQSRGPNGAGESFNRSFADYRSGFGRESSDTFWLGLDNIHSLTSSGMYELEIRMTTQLNNQHIVKYQYFRVGSSSSNYKLYIDGFLSVIGNAGDAFDRHNGMEFSTLDSDNDIDTRHCAKDFVGGWWYRDCFRCKLNGEYNGSTDNGILWNTLPVAERLLIAVDMRVSRKRCEDGGGITDMPTTSNPETTIFTTTEVDTTTIEAETTTTEDSAIDEPTTNRGGILVPRSCEDIYANGIRRSGRYQIFPIPGDFDMSADVYCDFVNNPNPEIWTVIQKRTQDSSNTEFYRDWAEYEEGFGSINVNGGFWVGLRTIHELTKRNDMELSIRLVSYNDDEEEGIADYSTFIVGGAEDNYRLTTYGYTGNIGDSFVAVHNGMQFSTFDEDNDVHPSINCAEASHGGWWYKDCFASNLNGDYVNGNGTASAVSWMSWHGLDVSLKETEMRIRKKVVA